MHRRLLILLALAAVPAGTASAEPKSFTGSTSEGSPIAFTVDGGQMSAVTTQLPMVCTGGRAGIEQFQPAGAFPLGGADTKVSELRASAVLNREATMNHHVAATQTGTTVSGRISLNYATTDFNILTMLTTVTVCDGSADFTATTAAAEPVVKDPPKKQKRKKQRRKRHGRH